MSTENQPYGATSAGRLWGARFSDGPAQAAWELGVSIATDHRMWPYDLASSTAHADELLRIGVLTAADHAAITGALDTIRESFALGEFEYTPDDEDIHGAIERRLVELLGETGGRLRAGRSRNDQVINDARLWLAQAIDDQRAGLKHVITTLADQAALHAEAIAPGFTHLQRAQPVTIGHHLAAYGWMLARDLDRLHDCKDRIMAVSPLGSGALAGLTLPLDPMQYAQALGYTGIAPNSMDAVADRDFMVEYLAAVAIIGMHLSRLCEDIILWSSVEFGWARCSDAFSTGSSIMPQKRNPDIAELVRGKAGRLFGAVQALLTMCKGLPLTYNRDLQEDKVVLFDAADTLDVVLPAVAGMIEGLTFNTTHVAAGAGGGFAMATDIAEALVRAGMPFRQAHEVVGSLVASCEAEGIDIIDLSPAQLAERVPALQGLDTAALSALVNPHAGVARRNAPNGAGAVREQVVRLRAAIS
ncbi:argininosuccinate lyase [Stomatohabitans albus]